MKLWKLKGARKLTMEETPATALTSGMVKVKVEEVLFSSLDYSIYSGEIKRKYPFVMGRNAVGVISDVYDKKQSMFKKMDRVVVEPYIPCNNCDECLKQDYENCTELKYMGQNSEGLLRNFVDVSINQVHRLPENLSYEEALWVPHVAFCLNIVDALNVEKGRHVAIFSSTKTGIILAQLLLYYQGVPILVSDNESLLKNARELGIFYCLDSKKVNVEQEILTITGGRMCREVVLFSNSDFSVKNVYSAAAPNATICLAGYSNKDSKLSLSQISQKHLTVFGVYNGVGNFSSAINSLVTGTVKVEKLLDKKLKFDKLDEQLETLSQEGLALKSQIIKVD